jgi:excisionase family DNA binding protein
MKATQQTPLLTVAETAARLGLSEQTIRVWAKSGKLPVIRLSSRSLRFDPVVVQALIDEHRDGARETREATG